MATIQHKNIDNSQLHEPKDIFSASVNKVYVSNGLGSGTWQPAIAHGGSTFLNETTPFSILVPNLYTKIAPVTSPQTSPVEFLEGTDCSLTYIGSKQRVAVINANVSLSDVAAYGRNASLAIYRNNVILPFTFTSFLLNPTGLNRTSAFVSVKTSAVSGDKFEVYIKTGVAANVNLHAIQLTALAYL